MLIRKLFKFENAHIVRNCHSDRCKYSIHGHSYKVEVFFRAWQLDNAGMVLDFSLVKDLIGEVIDSWDHSIQYWDKDNKDYIVCIKTFSDRWISTPVSPSAENMARMFYVIITQLLRYLPKVNGEDLTLKLEKVRVHETATGYAESDEKDIYNANLGKINIIDIIFSEAIKKDWKGRAKIEGMLLGNHVNFGLAIPEQQVKV